MASMRREVRVDASPEAIWSAARDVGAVHERLAPGFVVDTRMEEGARVVTFANGQTARELIVDVDDAARRPVWAVVGSPRLTHHNASTQVLAEGDGGMRQPRSPAWPLCGLPGLGGRRQETARERGDIRGSSPGGS